MRKILITTLALAALAASPVLAQTQPPQSPATPAVPPASAPPVADWSATAQPEEITVSARVPGPPLWHVKGKDADLWILGLVYPVPKEFEWDHYRVKDALQQARTVYLPPTFSLSLIDAGWFYLTQMDTIKQPKGVTVDDTLPPDLRARLDAWREKLQKRKGEEYLGAFTAWDFEQSFRKRFGLNGTVLDKQVEALAEQAHVAPQPLFKVSATPVVYEIRKMPKEAHVECIRDALDDMDTQAVHAQAAAKAWADGDLAGIKANYSEWKLLDCLDHTKTAAAARASMIEQTYKAAKSVLNGGSPAMIVVNMGVVLRKGGLIDRLKADGYDVTAPRD